MRAAILVGVVAACAAPEPPAVDLDRARVLAEAVEAERLMPWVVELADGHRDDDKLGCDGIPPADGLPACDLSNRAARELIARTLEHQGYRVDTEELPGDEMAHVLSAEWPGTTHADEVVIVGAHYDAFHAGADDNSSGVAAMLAISGAVRHHRFARTIRFVAFDLEERGSTGSTRYVSAGHANGVVAALILEAVGYASTEPGSQESPLGLPLPDVGDFLLVVADDRSAPIAERMLALGGPMAQLPTVAIIARGEGPMTAVLDRSDNAPFWSAGIPAVMLTDTANFRNAAYHTADDTPETLDPVFLAGVTRTTAGAVAELAELLP